MRPCWNRFTLSEFICLLIVTVGIPRRNCKTPKHKHTNIRQNKHWFWCEMLNMFAFCWIMFATSILGSLRSGGSGAPIGHALILSHQGTAADVVLLVFLQQRLCHGDLPKTPSTQHTWTLGWNDYPLLLLQYLPGCCRCCSPSIPCINLHPRSRLLSHYGMSKRVYQGKQMSCQNGRTSCVLYIVVVLVDPLLLLYMEVAPRSRRLSSHTRNSQTHTHTILDFLHQ